MVRSSKTIPSTMVGRWLLLTRLAVRMGVKHAFSFHQNYEDNLSDPIRYLGIFRNSRQAARSHFGLGPFHKHSSSQMHHPDPPDFGRGCQHTSTIKGLSEGKSETLENLRPITQSSHPQPKRAYKSIAIIIVLPPWKSSPFSPSVSSDFQQLLPGIISPRAPSAPSGRRARCRAAAFRRSSWRCLAGHWRAWAARTS